MLHISFPLHMFCYIHCFLNQLLHISSELGGAADASFGLDDAAELPAEEVPTEL